MFNLFAHAENNLGRAGWLLIIMFGGVAAAGLVLTSIGITTDYIFIAAWLFNLVTAWYISRAAKALGKSPLLYGLVSALAPPGALFAWFKLHSIDSWQSLERKHGAATDDAQ
jgi:hypothetical protein